ncbi:TPA: hypothetical protein U2L45_000704 [Citrobacter freundii]|nr:hypothetical protein [Citrobacter freundii]
MKPTYEELEQQVLDMAVQLANAESKCRELAAENARCKFEVSRCHQTVDEMFKNRDKWIDKEWLSSIWSTSKRLMNETPATDAFLAEVRAQARNEGVNYAASRLAAAFNHGFVDKPPAEVCDVVRMILDTKEELANSTLPAADGISGEYAEKFLAEFAAQLRIGAAL